jgi:hypothetical protein
VASSEKKSHLVLATLERCRSVLLADADRETAELVALAILQLRMKLNCVADSDLKALCDAMMRFGEPVAVGSCDGPPAFLKLVK